MFVAGEDIAFSSYLQKAGINTYVPPHPKDRLDLWGSDPTKAWKYGQEPVGISMGASSGCFERALRYQILNNGFRTMNNDRAIQEGRKPF